LQDLVKSAARIGLLGVTAVAVVFAAVGPAEAAQRSAAVRSTGPAKTARWKRTDKRARPFHRLKRGAGNQLKRGKDSFGKLRISGGVGVRTGLIAVTGVGAEAAFLLRPKDEARAEGTRRAALYTSGGLSAGPVGARGFLSHDPSLIGYEYQLGPGSKKNPVHGDKIGVPVIPGFLSISASRKGGLGFTFGGLPVPVIGRYPLVWGSVSFYIGHPAMAGMSNAVLDNVDRVKSRIGRVFRPVKTWVIDPIGRGARAVSRVVRGNKKTE
jgi:hypothetical protein